MLGKDFLAPTAAVMLFPDLVQRLLPVPFLDDRAMAFEKSWEAAWNEVGKKAAERRIDQEISQFGFGVSEDTSVCQPVAVSQDFT